jgi:hypothetical protein
MSNQPQYLQITAAILLAATYLCALGIAVDTYLVHGPEAAIPNVVSLVLGTGLGVALNVLGLHIGATLVTNAKGVDNASH